MEIRKEQAELLSLLRYAMDERFAPLPDDFPETDITPILKEASMQAVMGMALYALLDAGYIRSRDGHICHVVFTKPANISKCTSSPREYQTANVGMKYGNS